ncbi:MAG: TA system VapC family ribonuclease toxin [Pseudolysinimonas sp.]
MIVDVNVLINATQTAAAQHERCRVWVESAFEGNRRVGFPWATQLAFVRMSTLPRLLSSPLTLSEAWELVDLWLAQPLAWVPTETPSHGGILRQLTTSYGLGGNHIPDAHLAALAIGHGVPIISCDTDFARFTELDWIDPSQL